MWTVTPNQVIAICMLIFPALFSASAKARTVHLDFNDFKRSENAASKFEDGFVLEGKNAEFDGWKPRNTYVSLSIFPFAWHPHGKEIDAFFSIKPQSDVPFRFQSVSLVGAGYVSVEATGLDGTSYSHALSLPYVTNAHYFCSGRSSESIRAKDLGVSDVDLRSLSFSFSAWGQDVVHSGIDWGPLDGYLLCATYYGAEYAIDDIVLDVPGQVPLPASAVLLGTTLGAAGAWSRRKRVTQRAKNTALL